MCGKAVQKNGGNAVRATSNVRNDSTNSALWASNYKASLVNAQRDAEFFCELNELHGAHEAPRRCQQAGTTKEARSGRAGERVFQERL
jgi:hypothetical protein